jgi:hypothetical protein
MVLNVVIFVLRSWLCRGYVVVMSWLSWLSVFVTRAYGRAYKKMVACLV